MRSEPAGEARRRGGEIYRNFHDPAPPSALHPYRVGLVFGYRKDLWGFSKSFKIPIVGLSIGGWRGRRRRRGRFWFVIATYSLRSLCWAIDTDST